MTKTMIKKDFFTEGTFHFESQSENSSLKILLPFAELEDIVEGLDSENSVIQLEYPVNDNKLKICIKVQTKGGSDSLVAETLFFFVDTYEGIYTLDDFQF